MALYSLKCIKAFYTFCVTEIRNYIVCKLFMNLNRFLKDKEGDCIFMFIVLNTNTHTHIHTHTHTHTKQKKLVSLWSIELNDMPFI